MLLRQLEGKELYLGATALGKPDEIICQLRIRAATRYLKVELRRPHGNPPAEAERLRWLQGRLPVPALRYADADERQASLQVEVLHVNVRYRRTLLAHLQDGIQVKIMWHDIEGYRISQ